MKEKFSVIRSQFNWRMLLMRVVMYAILLLIVVVLTPAIRFINVQNRLLGWLFMAIGFGIVSAIVRPIVQFFTLPFIFATYGLVVLLVNLIILLAFDWAFSSHFEIRSIWGALFGALLITLFGGFLESMLGLTAPVVPDSEEELRKRIRFQDRGLAYALFQAAPAELQKYAPVAGSLAEPLPSSPDTQDAQAILAALDAAGAQPAALETPPPESPSKPRRRLRKAPAQPKAETPTADSPTKEDAS
jgi:putative membrane protein